MMNCCVVRNRETIQLSDDVPKAKEHRHRKRLIAVLKISHFYKSVGENWRKYLKKKMKMGSSSFDQKNISGTCTAEFTQKPSLVLPLRYHK
jgi:hypothetical protein